MSKAQLPRHVFISQAHLIDYGGSEMVALEIAEYFAASGSKVTIGTWSVGAPLLSYLKNSANISYFDINDDRLNTLLQEDPPELAWIHHQIMPRYLLQNPDATAFVFNHMSVGHPLELSWSPVLESKLAGLHLYNSAETLDAHIAKGGAEQFDTRRMQTFHNPAPDAFSRVGTSVEPNKPKKKVGVVSNHVPDELSEVLANPPSDLEFTVIGTSEVGGSVSERVTPATLASWDAVITIGKTVQYAILSGVPVYCYDKFGGPGWLSPSNFERAESRNFSGRGFDFKGHHSLAREISEGLDEAILFANALKRRDLSRFTLSSAMGAVLTKLEELPRSQALERGEAEAHARQQTLVGHYLRNWLRAMTKLASLEM